MCTMPWFNSILNIWFLNCMILTLESLANMYFSAPCWRVICHAHTLRAMMSLTIGSQTLVHNNRGAMREHRAGKWGRIRHLRKKKKKNQSDAYKVSSEKKSRNWTFHLLIIFWSLSEILADRCLNTWLRWYANDFPHLHRCRLTATDQT